MQWRTHRSKGHTLTELIVVIAIIVIISTAAIVSFSGLSEAVALRNAARELATNIRKAQNLALVVSQTPGGGPAPQRFGLRISSSPGISYYLCADANNSGTCTTSEKLGADVAFAHGVNINAVSPNPLHLMFVAPEAYAQFNDGSGMPQPISSVTISLRSPKNLTKSVTVKVSGQVTVQ